MKFEDQIGIYAAAVSTFLLFWEVYKYREDKKSKLRVDFYVRHQAMVNGRSMGDFQPYFFIAVTNVGNYKRLIDKPRVETLENVGKDRLFSLVDVNDPNKYPCPLEPGEQYQYWLPAPPMAQDFINKGVTMIRIHVEDTHLQVYKSEWIRLQ